MNMILLSFLFLIFAILTMKYKEKNRKRIFFDSTLFFIYGLLTITYFVATYFTGSGINETIIATLNLGLESAGFGEYFLLIMASLSSFIVLFVSAFFYYHHLDSVSIAKPQKIKAFMHNGFLILAFLTHPALHDLKNLYENMTIEQANDFYEYYKTPDLNQSSNGKNIVYIYAESLERTYFDEAIFPDLVPHLSELIRSENGVEFTNINQVSGSNYTIAGVVSTQCAIPLYTTSSGNSMEGVDKFYPKAICLGDVLKKQNYYLSFMQGGSVKFSGMDKFYKTHGFDSVSGKEELLPKLKEKKYINGWGLYDDSVLDLAFSEFEKLSSSKEKFALVLNTLDTHHPNGQLSASCSSDLYLDGSNDMLNTVKCSDMLISKFIKKIKSSKYGSNTIIVITSDHLAMRNTARKELSTSDHRRNLFVVFDPSSSEYRAFDKEATPFDVASTLLSFIGIDTDVGLGRNLREKESIYGLFEDFDKRLNQWRHEILRFWRFPKMSESFRADLKKKVIHLGENRYTLPVLFRVLDNNIEPYFEFNYSWKLYEQLYHFKQDDKFLWIDECNLMNYVFDANESGKYCVSEGILGGRYKVSALENKRDYYVDKFDENVTNYDSYETVVYKLHMLMRNGARYNASLKEGMVFKKEGYPSFLKNIQGVSYPDKVGRWTDGWLHPSALFTFEKPLPSKFTLELTTGAYGENIGNAVIVKVGDQIKEFTPKHKMAKKYSISFDNVNSADTIEIIPPKPHETKDALEGVDIRKFGLHLVKLDIVVSY